MATRYYTPTYRGFDTHFGFWSDKTDYFSHENKGSTVSFVCMLVMCITVIPYN